MHPRVECFLQLTQGNRTQWVQFSLVRIEPYIVVSRSRVNLSLWEVLLSMQPLLLTLTVKFLTRTTFNICCILLKFIFDLAVAVTVTMIVLSAK